MKATSPRRALAVIAVSFGAFLAGCSSFERDWAAIGRSAEAGPGIEGRWSGIWHSYANGHEGGLRCIISPGEAGALEARYHATYGALIGFEYTVPLLVTRDGDTYRFSAEADLGWLAGGLYQYTGTVVGEEFTSTYTSSGDHGTFRMRRRGPDHDPQREPTP